MVLPYHQRVHLLDFGIVVSRLTEQKKDGQKGRVMGVMSGVTSYISWVYKKEWPCDKTPYELGGVIEHLLRVRRLERYVLVLKEWGYSVSTANSLLWEIHNFLSQWRETMKYIMNDREGSRLCFIHCRVLRGKMVCACMCRGDGQVAGSLAEYYLRRSFRLLGGI